MDVTPLVKEGAQIIQSYAGGQFRVSGVSYSGPVIVTPSSTVEWGCLNSNDIADVQSLNEAAFDEVIALADEVDVVLLGTGAQMQFLDPALRNALKDKGLSIDVMDTGAACRTYNVLMAEGRRVAAVLFPF